MSTGPADAARAQALVARHEDGMRATEARRRGGRYYTPPVLVRFLVARVLGPLVAGRTADEVVALRVLDPSCGAGAFLLGALDFLADALVERGVPRDVALRRLVAETLLGVDTDGDALATARAALAVASGAEPRGLHRGDALARRGLAASAGVPRLDAVIGNPPYRREKDGSIELARARATDLGRRFGAGKMDLWFLFAHAALEALEPGGRHGFVVPSYWLEARSARRLREHLLSAARLEVLVDLGTRPFFKDVQGRHVVYVCEKGPRGRVVEKIEVAPPVAGEAPLDLEGPHPAVTRAEIPLDELVLADGTIGRGGELERIAALLDERGVRADFEVGEGVTPGPEAWTKGVATRAALARGTTPEVLERERGIARGEGVFVVPLDFELPPDERACLMPWAAPMDVPAFPAAPRASGLILYLAGDAKPGPRALAHLERFRPALDRRRETLKGTRPWYELHWPRRRELFSGPRVLLPRMVSRPRAAFIDTPLVVGESVLVIRTRDARTARLAAALLNTAPLGAWLLARAKRRGVGVDVSVARAREIPWPRALFEAPGSVEPIARALERGDGNGRGADRSADDLAWALYGLSAGGSARPASPRGRGTRRESRG